MKTLKVNFLAMTALIACCFMVLESCRKEPDLGDKDGGWCGTTDPKCNRMGTIAYLPTQCLNTVMSDVLGIRDDNGKYYLIFEDKTGRFGEYKEGDRVRFGSGFNEEAFCCLTCECPRPDFMISLTCIGAPNTTQKPDCGFGDDKGKGGDAGGGQDDGKDGGDGKYGPCSTPAKVVSYTFSGSIYQTVGKLIEIDGKHYQVVGSASQDIENMEVGTQIYVSHSVAKTDCYLPAVITTPNIDGCIELACINEKVFIGSN